MGYYTQYTIELQGTSSAKERQDIITDIENTCELGCFVDNGDGSYFIHAKWYNMAQDILDISKKYPHILFFIEGIGEEHDDIWRAYIQDHKSQYVKGRIEFDDYDPSKMVADLKI